MKTWPSLVVIVLVFITMSYLGGSITARNKDWYRLLELPSFNPPDRAFGIAWTIIYVLSGIAAWRLWNLTPHDSRFWVITSVAVVNIILNVGWSYVFFGMHQFWPAVIVCAAVCLTVTTVAVLAWPRDGTSAVLLLPYILWTAFATFLNATIASLNT